MNSLEKIDRVSAASRKCPATNFPVIRKPEWHFQADNFSVRYEVISGNVLHGISTGQLKENHIEPAFRLKENVISSMGPDSDSYYYVLGLTGCKGAGQKARKLYIKAILSLYRKYPFQALIFYGSNRLLTAGINLVKPFVPFKVRVVNDFDMALNLIAEEKPRDRQPSNLIPIKNSANKIGWPDQIQDYVEELLDYIEEINWEVDGINQIEEQNPNHPFRPVFDAIKLIKWELDDLYQQRISVEKALRESETKFRNIIESSPMGMHMYKLGFN